MLNNNWGTDVGKVMERAEAAQEEKQRLQIDPSLWLDWRSMTSCIVVSVAQRGCKGDWGSSILLKSVF